MKKSKNLLLSIGLLLVLVCILALIYKRTTTGEEKVAVTASSSESATFKACNDDTKKCSNGTVVGRSGKNCDFDSCPSNPPATIPQSSKKVVLYGTVLISPTCPVERIPTLPECAPKPYITEVTAFDETSFEVVASTKTSQAGNFEFNLLPGSYTIRAKSGQIYPRCEEKAVRLLEKSTSSLTISCDSGIR